MEIIIYLLAITQISAIYCIYILYEKYNNLLNTFNHEKKILNRQYKYLKQASKIIFTSPLTEKIYLSKYEDILKGKTNSITNGFDEDIFIKKHKYLKSDKFIISYIGRLTKGVRDPNFFLHGFDLACENQEFASKVTLRMIGYMHDFIEELEAANKYYNIEITNKNRKR